VRDLGPVPPIYLLHASMHAESMSKRSGQAEDGGQDDDGLEPTAERPREQHHGEEQPSATPTVPTGTRVIAHG
jgi:hypothetical protein